MSRFTPPTPRSRRLGRELRKLREARPLRIDDVAKQLRCSPSRISRIESGDIKARPGDVMELLVTYDIPLDKTCTAYSKRILELPALREWIAAAKLEPDDIDELDAEF